MNPYDQNNHDGRSSARKAALETARQELDENLHEKVMSNLQWAMLFYLFNNSADEAHEKEKLPKNTIQKRFMKLWLQSVNMNITMPDIKAINDVLTTPKNLFFSALQNPGETTESTEQYQQKYNKIISRIEAFFLGSTLTSDAGGGPPPDEGKNPFDNDEDPGF